MRSPAETYIKYLLSTNHSIQQIIEMFSKLQLDFISDKYLREIRDGLKVPKPFITAHNLHRQSFLYIRKHKISQACYDEPAFKQALCYVKSPRIKEYLETMVIDENPDFVISKRIQQRFHPSCTTDIISCYKHYFWDLSVLSRSELQALIKIRYGNEAFIEDDSQKGLIQKAVYNDPRYTAASSPIPIISNIKTQLQFGAIPKSIEVTRLLDAGITMGLVRTLESLHVDKPQSAAAARDYSAVVKNLAEVRDQLGSPDDDFTKELFNLALQEDHDQLPLYETLPTSSKNLKELHVIDTEGTGQGEPSQK